MAPHRLAAGASDTPMRVPISRAAGLRGAGASYGTDDRGQPRRPGGHCHVWLCRRKQPHTCRAEHHGTHDRPQPVLPTPPYPDHRTSGMLFWQQFVLHNTALSIMVPTIGRSPFCQHLRIPIAAPAACSSGSSSSAHFTSREELVHPPYESRGAPKNIQRPSRKTFKGQQDERTTG